jgi:hypothetical protein
MSKFYAQGSETESSASDSDGDGDELMSKPVTSTKQTVYVSFKFYHKF